MLNTVVVPDVPEFITDKLGQEIRPGDRIVYATAQSSSAYLNIGTVLGFQYNKPASYETQESYRPYLKIKVDNPENYRPSLINVSQKHYVKVIAENVN